MSRSKMSARRSQKAALPGATASARSTSLAVELRANASAMARMLTEYAPKQHKIAAAAQPNRRVKCGGECTIFTLNYAKNTRTTSPFILEICLDRYSLVYYDP